MPVARAKNSTAPGCATFAGTNSRVISATASPTAMPPMVELSAKHAAFSVGVRGAISQSKWVR